MMKRRFVLIFAAIVLLSCQHAVDPTDTSLESISQNYSHITEPKARWQAYGLKNYTIEQQRICFCGFPHGFVKLTVQNNKIVAGTDLANGQPVLADLLQYYQTIDELFDWIEQAKAENPARTSAEYDARFGYPNALPLITALALPMTSFGSRCNPCTNFLIKMKLSRLYQFAILWLSGIRLTHCTPAITGWIPKIPATISGV
jgi:lipopolysaccharide export LptBFGC system permease protein LptF